MNLTCMEGEGASTHLQDISRRVARIFRGGGVRLGSEDTNL